MTKQIIYCKIIEKIIDQKTPLHPRMAQLTECTERQLKTPDRLQSEVIYGEIPDI
jgi:hypothetical protein